MREPAIIRAELGLGGNRKGTEKGPVRITSMTDIDFVKTVENTNERTDEPVDAKNEEQIKDFVLELSEEVSKTLNNSKFPVVLGGDHSVSIGSVMGSSKCNGSTGLIWIDAHADFNTPETSPSGNVHGMPVAAVTGRGRFNWVENCVKEENVVMIGIRDVDEEEQENLDKSNVKVYTMDDVKEKGIEQVSEEALEQLSEVDNIHVSFDLDFLDSEKVPGVGTPVENGGTVEQAVEIIEKVDEHDKLQALDIVELNPELDKNDKTALKAVEVIEKSVISQKIKNYI